MPDLYGGGLVTVPAMLPLASATIMMSTVSQTFGDHKNLLCSPYYCDLTNYQVTR